MAEPIRQELDAVGEAITKVNPKLLSEETFLANKGTYLGNFFTKYIAPTEETRISTEALARGRKARIPTKEFTQRKDFAENIIEKVGDFFKLSSKDKQIVINATRDKDLPSLGGKLQKIRSDVENILERGQVTINDLKFQTSARRLSQIINERVRKSVGLIEEGGLPAAFSLQKGQLGLVRSKFFKELVDKGSVIDIPDETFRFQLPDSAQLGEATGKFVNRADYDAIMKTIMPDDGLTKLWKDGLRFWKTSKIAYNPSTIARNDLTNFLILNPLGGVGPHRLDIYYKTVKEFYEGGELWQRFRKVGGGLSSQSRGELIAKATELYKKNSNIRQQFKKVEDFHKAVVNFYGNQDTFFKFSNFIKGIMNDGLSDFAAMKRANFYLVDYSEVPKVVEWMRNSPIGAPFISFTYGVSLPLAKTLLERPDKLSAYFKILRAMQSLGADQTIDESILPENLKDQPYSALQMPFKDEFGRPQFIDMRYILPFNILEPTSIANNTLGSIPGISQFGQNPVMQFFGGILTNTNPYTGKKIVPDGSTPGEAIMAVIDYVQKIILPSLAPGIPTRVQGQTKIGGFGLEKLKSAIEKHPDFAGRERSVPKTLFDVLGGIKIQPVDLELQQRLQNSELKKQFEELRSQAVRTQLSKTMTKEEKEKELARLRQKVFELAQQLKERTK